MNMNNRVPVEIRRAVRFATEFGALWVLLGVWVRVQTFPRTFRSIIIGLRVWELQESVLRNSCSERGLTMAIGEWATWGEWRTSSLGVW